MKIKWKIPSYHLLPATVLHSSTFIQKQPKRLRLGRLQLLLLWQDHTVKVRQRLGLKLWYLENIQATESLSNSVLWNSRRQTESQTTSSFRFSSNFFSLKAFLSRSLCSKEKGQTSTRWFSGSRGWKGRPKWGTGGALTGDGCLTWQRQFYGYSCSRWCTEP